MAVAEQRFYRGDALRLGNRKQFCGVCVKPKEFTKDQFSNKSKLSIGEKQDDPVLCPRIRPVYETGAKVTGWKM